VSYPTRVPSWRRYLRFWGSSVQSDIDAELRFHFDARISELVAQGVELAAARAQAVEEFDDVSNVSEALRDIDGRMARRHSRVEWISGVKDDVVYGIRSLRRAPAVTATIILTLALGLGVNAAMFSFLDQVFGRYPAGVAKPETVHRLWSTRHFGDHADVMFWPRFDYKAYAAVTEAVGDRARTAIYGPPTQLKLGTGEQPPKAWVTYAGTGYFELLGVRMSAGRFFSTEENRLGANIPVAVVSDAFRRRMLNSDSSAIGQRITVGKRQFTVIGVTEPKFTGLDLDAADIWLPLGSFGVGYVKGNWWDSPNVNGFGVLLHPTRPGIDRQIEDRATLALRSYMASLTGNWGGNADTATDARVGSIIIARGPGEQKQEVKVATRLAGVAAIVFLIACANVINLLLARALQRRREIAVRLALGISRSRLVRLLVAESVLLAVVAGVAAVLAAQWGGSLLRSLLLPDVHWATGTLSLQVVLFAMVASIVAGAVAGVIPAWQASRPDLTDALKAGAREGVLQKSGLRSGLVMVQAALSVLLLAGAALFVKSLRNVHDLNIGFAADRLTFASITFDTKDSIRDASVKPAMDQLAQRIRGMPGVEQVALTGMQPMNGISWLTWRADRVLPKGQPDPTYFAVSPEYFSTTGVRVVRGTGFPNVHGTATPRAVVINQAMAQEVWPGENPIGRCMRFGERDAACYTIIGIVENARRNQIIEEAKPQYYVPFDNPPARSYMDPTLIVRSTPARASTVGAEVRAMLKQTWPTGIPNIKRMSDQLEPQYRPWKLGATLFSTFGLLALIVAAIGIYSTVSYGVTQRTHEFGVRLALGARIGDVLRLVIGEGMRTVAIGVAIGIALALAAGRLIVTLLYGIEPSNAFVIAGVSIVLLGVAIIAALAPAWRAARVDPVNALRTE
jgi:putative ABC transport system permease protein